MRKPIWIVPVLLLWAVASALAADTVLTWPAKGNDTMLRFTLGKLRQISSVSGQSDYLGEALAENLSTKAIPSASFYLYLLDKNGKRVGEGYLEVTNLAAGQRAKIPVCVHALGSFASMELQPQHLPSAEPMKIKMSVTSVPSGASLKLDSQESGVAPQVLSIAPGKHVLEFSKEGYATESTPLEIAENALPGSVELELSPLALGAAGQPHLGDQQWREHQCEGQARETGTQSSGPDCVGETQTIRRHPRHNSRQEFVP